MSTTETECARLILETFPHTMRALAHDVRARPGIPHTLPQYRVLAYLFHHGPESMGKLAEQHGVMLPTMTKIVGGLVERGMVERRPDERDRRVVRLHLTHDGAHLFEGLHRHMEARLAALVGTLSEADREALAVGLRALRRSLEAELTAASPVKEATETPPGLR